MFKKSNAWYTALSNSSKIFVLALTSVVGISLAASASPGSPAPPQNPIVQTPEKEEKEAVVETKLITETNSIAYQSSVINDANLEQGKTEIRTPGVNGVKNFVYEVTYENGVEKSKKLSKEEVVTQPVNQVTALGTKKPYVPPAPAPKPLTNCAPGYSPCVPNVSYDLDCPDIGFQVSVSGSDPHGFDRDGDGYGCESY